MYEDVFELPRVIEVEIIVYELIASVEKWVPICVKSSNRGNVRILDLQASLVIHLIAFH